ncbi:class I SAM-dependent methyltransferase [Rhodoferax sp. UBA5149]|uniref:class I SAM-dependent methyltransferase n=1 Tax=Rhodoferax sp. UBA5149 TaxID=1947379 RepID=UPI0025F35800|nr:class I SAM-dependent methyltransferase [Rhodoferax sp. UBA5149]
MPAWLLYTVFSLIFVLASTALFFFTLTRGALIMRAVLGNSRHDAAHVYPIYSNMWLIRLVDFQPVIAAILLFQYDRLVSAITSGLNHMDLRGKTVLITSCAFGNVIPRVVTAAIESGARQVLIADIIKNELDHAQGKLSEFSGKLQFLQENATAMKQADGSVAVNVIFFLLHELPHPLKGQALREAARVLAPGGKLYLAEFHRPDVWVLRALSWTYFKVFEPLGLALWHTHDPLKQLEAMDGFTCERRTVFFGNFQILVATKNLVA